MTKIVLTFETQEQADSAVLALSKGYRVEQWYMVVNTTMKPYCVSVYVPTKDAIQISEADKQDDKWEPHSEFCNKEETGGAEENICNTCLFKGKCPSENKKEVYELCETIKKQAKLYFKNKEEADE